MDFTMLRQMCRRGRAEALLQNHPSNFANILLHKDKPNLIQNPRLTGIEQAEVLAKGKRLTDADYSRLLAHLASTGLPWRAYNAVPHPHGALILPPTALHPTEFHWDNHIFSCFRSHRGNSAMLFCNPSCDVQYTGFIESIWQTPLQDTLQTFLCIQLHKLLPQGDEEKAPFLHHPDFQIKIMDASPSEERHIIRPSQIITPIATYDRPSGTYGIGTNILVICWALNRGRNLIFSNIH
jgi:hypothetical protein